MEKRRESHKLATIATIGVACGFVGYIFGGQFNPKRESPAPKIIHQMAKPNKEEEQHKLIRLVRGSNSLGSVNKLKKEVYEMRNKLDDVNIQLRKSQKELSYLQIQEQAKERKQQQPQQEAINSESQQPVQAQLNQPTVNIPTSTQDPMVVYMPTGYVYEIPSSVWYPAYSSWYNPYGYPYWSSWFYDDWSLFLRNSFEGYGYDFGFGEGMFGRGREYMHGGERGINFVHRDHGYMPDHYHQTGGTTTIGGRFARGNHRGSFGGSGNINMGSSARSFAEKRESINRGIREINNRTATSPMRNALERSNINRFERSNTNRFNGQSYRQVRTFNNNINRQVRTFNNNINRQVRTFNRSFNSRPMMQRTQSMMPHERYGGNRFSAPHRGSSMGGFRRR